MNLSRRRALHLAASAAALSAVPLAARAQVFPSRPVRIVVGFPAGGGSDFLARLMGQSLSERLGQPFVTDNRPGVAGNIATEAVVRAPADGYTLLLVDAPKAINTSLYDQLSFNFIRDIAPVAGIMRVPNVLVVHPSVPAKTVSELVAYARANPGKLNMASGGNGSSQHVSGELFKMMAGINLVHVPYRGEVLALPDLLGGQVQLMFGNLPASIEHVRAGRLRALAVTTSVRSAVMPEVPTIGEFLAGYEASVFYGVGAPTNTPREIIGRLNKEINASIANPGINARLAELGATMIPGSPDDFGRLIVAETEKWGKVIRAANIKAE